MHKADFQMDIPNHIPSQFLLLDGCGSQPMPTMISIGQFTNHVRRNLYLRSPCLQSGPSPFLKFLVRKQESPPLLFYVISLFFFFLNVNNVTDATLSKRKQTFHYYAYFHQYLAYPYLQIVLSRLG